ncbi:ABC transporter substrate-binding protein [Acidomonas methanolica]|uniref:Extracellular solute-binding protein n=3 Tax=Acidomonas methanolica TaxID=437 RepID=A0A023D1B8_ACIMT|nr:ABC transporter substrate-binding protein [Acidomonas methanolica]MBU2654137.1 ABC transporter substrate-binding protein [Acidomonas methanolica]GAJ27601.1 extracellular solute-binding protein [Acidomonas methanolica NBRC 104435]GEK98805.1 ABC transporter substrate-binding protein [Acidomonas methanolica NBRC 104435]
MSLSRRAALGFGLGGAGILAAGPRAGAQTPDTPRRGGHLRLAGFAGSTADTLDPARMSAVNDFVRGKSFYDGLVALDDTMAPRPGLAERLDTDDFRTWHITLRRDVCFHDGAPLTASDVVYSLNRHKDPAIASHQRIVAMEMRDIRATGPLTVEIGLVGPNVDFPAILGMDNFAIIRDGTKDFSTANGTGPFICTGFQPGIRTTGRRNPEYWGQPAWLETIDLIAISDDMARHDALLSGDVDIIASANPRLVRLLRARRFGIMESPVGTYTDLAIRLDQSPGHSADFVMGMKYLFNREQVRDSVFLGFARIANDHPIPPEDPYFAADLPQRVYDPDRARFHLKRAGLGSGELALFCSPAALASVDIAVLLQYAAQRAAGLDLGIRRMPVDGYWSQYWMRTPMSFGNTNARPSVDMTFALSFFSRATMNESRWRNPRFDALLLQARGERDDAVRRRIYHDMQAMVRDGSGVCIPAFTTSLDAFDPKVRGLRPNRAGQLMGYGFTRWVWLDGGGVSP